MHMHMHIQCACMLCVHAVCTRCRACSACAHAVHVPCACRACAYAAGAAVPGLPADVVRHRALRRRDELPVVTPASRAAPHQLARAGEAQPDVRPVLRRHAPREDRRGERACLGGQLSVARHAAHQRVPLRQPHGRVRLDRAQVRLVRPHVGWAHLEAVGIVRQAQRLQRRLAGRKGVQVEAHVQRARHAAAAAAAAAIAAAIASSAATAIPAGSARWMVSGP